VCAAVPAVDDVLGTHRACRLVCPWRVTASAMAPCGLWDCFPSTGRGAALEALSSAKTPRTPVCLPRERRGCPCCGGGEYRVHQAPVTCCPPPNSPLLRASAPCSPTAMGVSKAMLLAAVMLAVAATQVRATPGIRELTSAGGTAVPPHHHHPTTHPTVPHRRTHRRLPACWSTRALARCVYSSQARRLCAAGPCRVPQLPVTGIPPHRWPAKATPPQWLHTRSV
jgi:hypothetical protein